MEMFVSNRISLIKYNISSLFSILCDTTGQLVCIEFLSWIVFVPLGQVNLVPKGAVARFVDPGIVMLNETKFLTKDNLIEPNV